MIKSPNLRCTCNFLSHIIRILQKTICFSDAHKPRLRGIIPRQDNTALADVQELAVIHSNIFSGISDMDP